MKKERISATKSMIEFQKKLISNSKKLEYFSGEIVSMVGKNSLNKDDFNISSLFDDTLLWLIQYHRNAVCIFNIVFFINQVI